MRVVLAGPALRRQRLRQELPDTMMVVGEAATLSAARRAAASENAYVLLIPPEDEDPLVEALTPRETQVLELVADGLSNKAIAVVLGVADETIKFHLASVLAKLGATNRTDAVRLAVRHGLVSL